MGECFAFLDVCKQINNYFLSVFYCIILFPCLLTSVQQNTAVKYRRSIFYRQVKDLLPSTVYEVSVRGVTVEPGEAAVLIITTRLSAPNIGSQLNLGKGPKTNTTVRIIIPAADRFLTNNR
jgi:hypothetical protein